MRDTSIESGKERTEMSLSSPGTEPEESPFPRDLNRSIFSKFAKFTPEAKAYFVDRLRVFTEQSIMNSIAKAEEEGLDTVSAINVERALNKNHPAPRSRFRKYAGVFGGVLLGAGISALVSLLMMTGEVTKFGVTLAFALSIAGAFLIALDN